MNKAIEFYRASPIKEMVRTVAIALIFMMGGMLILIVGLDNSGRVPTGWKDPLFICGIVSVIIGVLYAFLRFFNLLRLEERSLMLRLDGLLITMGDVHFFRAWQSIEQVTAHEQELHILSDSEAPLMFSLQSVGISNEVLCHRILDIQRKVLLGRLK